MSFSKKKEKKNWWHFRKLYELVGWIGQNQFSKKKRLVLCLTLSCRSILQKALIFLSFKYQIYFENIKEIYLFFHQNLHVCYIKNYRWNLNNAKTQKIRINKQITKECETFVSNRISEKFSYLIVLAQRIIIWNLIIILLVSKIQDK